MFEKKLNLAFRFDLQPASIQNISTPISSREEQVLSEYTLISLPLYAVESLPDIIDEIRSGELILKA